MYPVPDPHPYRPMQARDPRTGETDYTFDAATPDAVHAHAARLRHAQPAWAARSIEERAQALRRWRDEIAARETALTDALSVDTGRRWITHLVVQGAMRALDRWADLAPDLGATPAPRPSATVPTVTIEQQRVPYPLVGVISPWNFPLTLALIDTIPALLAGCAVVLKPSEVTPRFVEPLADAARAAGLDDVLAIVRGGPETGRAMTETVDAVCFTGSVATGRTVAAAAASRLITAFLELGGNDPALVLNDADVETATDAVLRSTCGVAGQACQSLERVYVQRGIYETFLTRLVEKAEAATLSYPDPHKGQIGPLIFEGQATTIQAQIDDARAGGATVWTGGAVETLGGGLWCRPTVLTDVTSDMKVMAEETFGPLVPVVPFDTVEEGIALANDTEFGLSASVFTRDLDLARHVASRIDAGAVGINDGSLTSVVYDAEKNSFKQSGLGGSRMGRAGFSRFFRTKALLFQTAAPAPLASQDEALLAR